MSALTIPSHIGPSIIVINNEAMARIQDLTTRAGEIPAITTPAEFCAADALLADAIKIIKEIEAKRSEIKRPVIDLGRAIDDAASNATAGLTTIKTKLGKRLLAFQEAENARREEERKRLEAQRLAAEAEERRIAAERAAQVAKAEAEERERQRTAALAEESAADNDAPPWEQPARAPAPVVAPAPEIVHIPTVLPPSYEEQRAAAPLKSSAVVSRTAKKVEVPNPELVPDEIAGVKLWILDLKTIDRLAKSGVVIPGVTVSEVTTISAKG